MIFKRLLPIVCISVTIAFMCHMDGIGGSRAGVELSGQTAALIAELNAHLTDAADIVYAESGLIRLKGHDNLIREYLLKDGMLWIDRNPVLDGIAFFHLEYRDVYGNLLTRPHKNLQEIDVVAYTMKVNVNHNNIITQYQTTRPKPTKDGTQLLALSIL